MKQFNTLRLLATVILFRRSNGFSLTPLKTLSIYAPTGGALLSRPSSKSFEVRATPSSLDPMIEPAEEKTTKNDLHSKRRASTQPKPVMALAAQNFLQQFDTTLKNNKSPGAAMNLAAVTAMAFALFFHPLPSDAAMSGGRMGGSFSSSPSSSRVQRSSYSSRSAYGGGSAGYGRGFSSGFASGVGAGYLSAPRYSYGFSSPFYSPYGYYGGGPGVITYSRGPNLLPLLFLGGLAFAASQAIGSGTDSVFSSRQASSIFDTKTSALGTGSSVVKVSVAMHVPNRDDPNSILSVLDRLSQTSQTNSRMGIQNLTSQVALEILRRKSSIRSAFAESENFRDESRAQREYNSQAFRERAKFESETISNYGGVDYSTFSPFGKNQPTEGTKATMAVVTLLLNINGDNTKMNQINSMSDVEDVLQVIATDAKVEDCLQGVEILWTPEDGSETLTSRGIIVDYPELRSV